MNHYHGRRIAALFLSSVYMVGSSTLPAFAAPRPETKPKNININQQSTPENLKKGAPVILKRDGNLPDISDIFGGYNVNELPTDIPTVQAPAVREKAAPRISEDGLVILEFRLGRTILNDALLGYSERGMLLLPIGQVADALQFPIQINLETGRAEGWFSNEDKSFLFDSNNARTTISGAVESVNRDRFDVRDDDIYVDSTLLAEWFSVAFDFSFAEQVVSVSSAGGVLLPAEKLLERAQARDALKFQRSDQSETYPTIREPYHAFTTPFADINSNWNYDNRTNPNSRADSSVLMNSDALYIAVNE